MHISKCVTILFVLVFINLTLLWYFTHIQIDYNEPIKEEKIDITIVIPEFEHFDNNIVETVRLINSYYPYIDILVLSETIPYPYINLPTMHSKFVIRSVKPSIPKFMSDPLFFIKTKYVIVVPDSVRIKSGGVLEELLWESKQLNVPIIASTVLPGRRTCPIIDLDLKRWSLKYIYNKNMNNDNCHYPGTDVALLFKKETLFNFTEPFDIPFFESFYIQAKLRNLQIALTKKRYFDVGKILFANNHNSWKHNKLTKEAKTKLYKRFGIKHVVDYNGVETWYGCTKQTPRCFSTVIDTPSYLYKERWTPPCCIEALRETSKHVFQTLESANILYWLEGGSLLGAARYKDIIPWDYDVDVGIYMKEINTSKLLTAVWDGKQKVDIYGFVWERAQEGDFIRVQYSSINHLHVDIFPFFERNKIMTKNTWFKTHRQDCEFPSHYLQPLIRLPFAGYMAFAPNNYKQFLEFKFGKGVIENPQYPFPEKLMSQNNRP